MESMSLAEIEAVAAKWEGTLEHAIRRLADSHLSPLPESQMDEKDRAALATVLVAAIPLAIPKR